MFGRKKQVARLPAVQIRSIEIPSVEIGGGRLPHIRTPELHTPELTIPQIDLSSAAPFVRVRRKNPLVQALKFVVGAGVGLAVGVVVAAMLTPYAGDDTRRKLRDLAKSGSKSLIGGDGDHGETQSFPIGTGEVREGIAGLLSNPNGRFQLAKEEAQKARQAKERELQAEFQTAKRTGSAPD